MNSADDRTTTGLAAAIDRLIDGELTDAQRRELLLKLEVEPDGWRRCALAFLEDREWRGAIGSGMMAPADPSVKPRPKPARRRLARASVAASLAAGVFALGFGLGGAQRSRMPVEVARPGPALESKAAEAELVRAVGWVNLVDQSAGESPPDRVPILSGPGLDDRWLKDQPPSVPDLVKAQWERKGYQVEEHRNLVSVTLDDGRRVSIPVDEVQVEYVGQRPL